MIRDVDDVVALSRQQFGDLWRALPGVDTGQQLPDGTAGRPAVKNCWIIEVIVDDWSAMVKGTLAGDPAVFYGQMAELLGAS